MGRDRAVRGGEGGKENVMMKGRGRKNWPFFFWFCFLHDEEFCDRRDCEGHGQGENEGAEDGAAGARRIASFGGAVFLGAVLRYIKACHRASPSRGVYGALLQPPCAAPSQSVRLVA